ncbi:E3 ubiquitin-protein ligase NEDD4-like isoform 1 [Schistosoma japonicum]|uniref:HECT-type E3 ubiquitin transferase n=1 Tax=Schistosoma japonicum TaxID=6182 RepID=A0A4Z2D1E8_SCHJA|nr:E3 ubiquitin-protein ligase NEDD4-like isoform 1 [Schistosoma japonicum]
MVLNVPSKSVGVKKHLEVYGLPLSLCNTETRLLRIRIIRALDLMKKDIFGASDPYCKLCIYKTQRSTLPVCPPVPTKTVKKSLNPIWNEEFIFRVNPSENRLVFELYDENRITRDDFLGVVTVFLPYLEIGTEGSNCRLMAKSFLLRPRSSRSRVRGNLHLYLAYLPNHLNPRISTLRELPPTIELSSEQHQQQQQHRSSEVQLSSTPVSSSQRPSLPTQSHSLSISEAPSTMENGTANYIPVRNTSIELDPESVAETVVGSMLSTSLDESCSVEMISDPLPPGWDERIDQNGRTYYVDHVNKRTQWDRPSFRLPHGWEQRTDANGRVYYVDHQHHRTTWYHPLSEGSRSQTSPPHSTASPDTFNDGDEEGELVVNGEGDIETESNFHVDFEPSSSSPSENQENHSPPADQSLLPEEIMNHRSQVPSNGSAGARGVRSVRPNSRHSRRSLTIAERIRAKGGITSAAAAHSDNRQNVLDDVRAAQTMYLRRRQVSLEDTVSHLPVNLDTSLAHDSHSESIPSTTSDNNTDAPPQATDPSSPATTYTSTTSISRLESPNQHGTDLVDRNRRVGEIVLGIDLAPGEEPLPQGWELARTASGRKFFINHNEHTTTWDDPRIIRSNTHIINGSLLTHEAQRHMMKDLGPLPPGWEERVHSNGRIFYINHNARTTQWEDPRLERLGGPAVPYSRNYKQKYDYFRSRLKAPRDPQAKFELRVTRAGIFEDSFRLIYGIKRPEVLMHRLWIEFIGEKGLDYGGVQREWFFLLSREMFNPYYGLFEYSAADNYTLQINPLSGMANEEHLKYFKFIGRVVGMAVYHGKLVDGFFIRPFYKMMLGKTISLKDMESVDSEYYRSLKYILKEDPASLDLTMSVEEEHFGETVEVDLIKDGRNIRVTNSNKTQYIERIINWRFVSRVEKQMCAFLEGFSDLIPLEALQIFDANELELLMCGLQDISVSDWKANTLYKGEYHANHPVIVNLWKAIYTFTNELRSRLLQFVTGTSRVPMNGFAELWGSSGPQKFTVECWGSVDQLPRAHTCFNRLDLPAYPSFEELRCKLIIAIENAEGFEGVD